MRKKQKTKCAWTKTCVEISIPIPEWIQKHRDKKHNGTQNTVTEQNNYTGTPLQTLTGNPILFPDRKERHMHRLENPETQTETWYITSQTREGYKKHAPILTITKENRVEELTDKTLQIEFTNSKLHRKNIERKQYLTEKLANILKENRLGTAYIDSSTGNIYLVLPEGSIHVKRKTHGEIYIPYTVTEHNHRKILKTLYKTGLLEENYRNLNQGWGTTLTARQDL